jgi:hypothetical protein
MAKREPLRRKRRPGGGRGVGPARPATGSPATDTAREPAVGGDRAGLEARIAFWLGALAFLALPLGYQWTFRPSSRPGDAELLVQVVELGGIIAAAGALLLGRRARAAGDRSSGAVWGPRLGGAAIVGYAMAFFLLMSRPA